jgi:hypothetical protein
VSSRDESNTQWWTLLEFTYETGMLLTLSLVQFCLSAREAAERSAGFQLGEGCRPRRIMVYPEAPKAFEWRQVRPYILEVGKEIQ